MTMESQTERIGCWSTAEQGDSSSAGEEVESPRSVVAAARTTGGGRWRRCRKGGGDQRDSSSYKGYLHSQVLRIKEEEMQIAEDLIGDYYYDNHHNINNYVASSHPLDDRVVIWARAILPASPLGGRKNNGNY